MALYLAVDAGGTKTDYVLADERRELARVRGGCIKRLRVDEPTAAANLQAALAELSATSSVSLQNVHRTCIGTAGNTVPLVTDWLREHFARHVSGELVLTGDVEIALDAAFQGGTGILVLAGTGSNVAGRGSDGTVMTVGGWGPMLADQGSGHRIGSEALRAILLARDEQRHTQMLEEVLRFWQLSSYDDLIEHANRTPHPDFSRLTALVLHCAGNGDEIATQVLRAQGEELGYLVRLMMRRLLRSQTNRTSQPDRHMPWTATLPSIAFAGSIMESVEPVRAAVVDFVRQEFPQAHAMPGVVDPIAGALWRARTIA